MTDRYQHIVHHPDVASLVTWASEQRLPLLGVDLVPGAMPLETTELPQRCVLVFGQEGPGLSSEMQAACEMVVGITQYGSTRSINAGVASGIAMHCWLQQHGRPS